MTNSNHTPVFLPLGVSRKKSDACSGLKSFKRPPKLTRPVPTSTRKEAAAKQLPDLKPGCGNRLLAGCMANEFLTKGTLFDKKFDPAPAESSSSAAISKSIHQGYAEVANLLKNDGVNIPGVVNPTQLSQWLSGN